MDEVLAERVLAREPHGTELPIHPAGEAAVRVDAAAEAVARLEERDLVPGFLEQHPGGEAGDPGADDDDVARFGRRREAVAERLEQVDGRSHAGERIEPRIASSISSREGPGRGRGVARMSAK